MFLTICDKQLRRQIKRSPNDSSILCHITYTDSSTSSDITNFKEQRILLKYQYVRWFDVPMRQLNLLQMCKYIEHGCYKIQDLILRKILLFLFTVVQELFKVCYSFLHLYVTFSTLYLTALISLLKTIAATILDDIWMWVHFKLPQKLNFFSKNKFTHVIF